MYIHTFCKSKHLACYSKQYSNDPQTSNFTFHCSNNTNVFHWFTAVCTQACQNGGICSAPDSCSCVNGWSGQLCEEGNCIFDSMFSLYLYKPAVKHHPLPLYCSLKICTLLMEQDTLEIVFHVPDTNWRVHYICWITYNFPMAWDQFLQILLDIVLFYSHVHTSMPEWRYMFSSKQLQLCQWVDWTVMWRRYTQHCKYIHKSGLAAFGIFYSAECMTV